MINIDPIVLGDNQFFGVNHMSQDKGNTTYEKFKDISEIKNILYSALDNGVKGVMFSTHPSIYEITDMIRSDDRLKNELSIYVNVPYIVKYISMVTEMGIYNTVVKMLEGQSATSKMKYLLNGALNVVSRDYLEIVNRLIDVELNPFHDLNVKAVFLHNCLTDLALGYDMVDVIKSFYNYVKDKYNVIPAFGTLNYPKMCDMLDKAGIEEGLIMTAVNKKGFLMNPSREAYEKKLKESKHSVMAMATLASGRVLPEEAYEYIYSLSNIKSVIVGLSSQKHADETFSILHKYV